jgi:hypothetical protein
VYVIAESRDFGRTRGAPERTLPATATTQGRRGGPLDVWSEDYQARVYTQQLALLAACDAVRGMSPWIIKDFRAPYRLQTRVQEYWNRKRAHYARLAAGEVSDVAAGP